MSQLWQALSFALAIAWFCLLPGAILLTPLMSKQAGWSRFFGSLALGAIFISLLAYICGLLEVRWLTPWLVSSISLISVVKWRFRLLPSLPYRQWQAWLLLGLTIIYSLSVTTSGWRGSLGMVFRGVNSQDGLWNIALIRELTEAFPPQHPAISGVQLSGYHIFYNLFAAEIVRITQVDVFFLHFLLLAFLLSALLVFGIYELCRRLGMNNNEAVLSTSMSLAGGSFAFLVPVFFGVKVSLDDGLGVTQPLSLLVSPSFVFSLICLVYGLWFLDDFEKNKSLKIGLIASLMFGVAAGYKVYAGMLAVPAFTIFALCRYAASRRIEYIFLAVLSIVLAGLVFFPLNSNYGSLIYQPFWPPHRLMQGVMNFTRWELKRQVLAQNSSLLGLVRLELWALLVFIVGNLGTRIIGLLTLAFRHRTPISGVRWMIMMMVGISAVLPMFFIQPIGAFNMIQFYWYSLVFVGIFAGWGTIKWLSRMGRRLAFFLGGVVLLLTLPSAVEKVTGALFGQTMTIKNDELEMYELLDKRGKYSDTVLEIPGLETYTEAALSDWFDKSHAIRIVSFGNKRVYWGNEVVQFKYDDWKTERAKTVQKFMRPQTELLDLREAVFEANRALQILVTNNKIRFIVSDLDKPWFADEYWAKKIYSSNTSSLYEVLPL